MTDQKDDTSVSDESSDSGGASESVATEFVESLEAGETSSAESKSENPGGAGPGFVFRLLKRLRSLFVSALALGCWLAIFLFAFSFCGRYFFVAELLGNFRIQMVLMLLGSAAVAICIGRKTLALILTVGGVWCLAGVLSVYLPASNPPPGTQQLRLMSFNVLASNSKPTDAIDQVREVDPDVLLVLEYARTWHLVLDCLNEEYPHQIRVPRWHGFGIALFSKYPLSETTVHQLTKTTTDNPFIVTNVNFGGQKIRVAGIHVVSPTTVNRMEVRNEQFLESAELLASQDVPTLVMGDFNSAPWSPFMKDFVKTTGYRETRQGFGIQTTWPSDRRWLRIPIDHAYVSDDIHVHDRIVGEPSSSDHCAIVLEVSTTKQ